MWDPERISRIQPSGANLIANLLRIQSAFLTTKIFPVGGRLKTRSQMKSNHPNEAVSTEFRTSVSLLERKQGLTKIPATQRIPV